MRILLAFLLAISALTAQASTGSKATPEQKAEQVSIPQILSEEDVQLYKRMFWLQRALQRPKVAKLVGDLDDRSLLGHLIAERLLHPNTKTPYRDLQKWLELHDDHPQAQIEDRPTVSTYGSYHKR